MQSYAFLFHLVKLQGTGFGLPFYVPDYVLTKQRAGELWGELFEVSSQRGFSYYMLTKQRAGALWGDLLEVSPRRGFSYVEPLQSRGI